MSKKVFAAMLLLGLSTSVFTACASEPQATQSTDTQSINQEAEPEKQGETEKEDYYLSEFPIKIEDLEVTIDEVNSEPSFWVKNNSDYKIGGPKMVRVVNSTGEILVADADQHSSPGGTSDVAIFEKESYDESGEFLGRIPATIEEVENSSEKTIEFDYYDENDDLCWMEYNYITKSYRGYNHQKMNEYYDRKLKESLENN